MATVWDGVRWDGVRTLRWVLAGRPSGGTVPMRRPSDPAAEPPRADYGNPR